MYVCTLRVETNNSQALYFMWKLCKHLHNNALAVYLFNVFIKGTYYLYMYLCIYFNVFISC